MTMSGAPTTRGRTICSVCKRDVAIASGKTCTHNASGTFEVCKGSRRVALCEQPGMVAGETCQLPSSHDGAHHPINARKAGR